MLQPSIGHVVAWALLLSLVAARESGTPPPFPFSTLNTLAYPYNYMHVDQESLTDRYEYELKLDKYIKYKDEHLPPRLVKDCNQRSETIEKTIRLHYDPDYYNCSIEYFHHPITKLATPNYKINIQSDVFGGMKMSERVAALDVLIEPLLVKPYRLTINARVQMSCEWNDNRAELELMKNDFAKYMEDEMKNYHVPGPMEAVMREKLKKAFDPEICQVINQSYRYDEPDDAETHFSVAVISYKFVRKTVKEAEAMVRHILRDELPHLKSVDIIADVPEVLPTLLPTPLVWYKQELYTQKPLEVEAWPF